MKPLALLLLPLLLTPALAGCAAPEAPAAARDDGASVAAAAQARAYAVAAEEAAGATAYPLLLPTNPPKPLATVTREGSFGPGECSPGGPLDAAIDDYHRHEVAGPLAAGDVFAYAVELRYANAGDASADLRLSYAIGSRYDRWQEPSGELRGEVAQRFEGQSYRLEEDDAWVAVSCWAATPGRTVAYTVTVTYSFAPAGVPAQTPVLVDVPEGATRLFVTRLPEDPARAVLSHYRVFGPDDSLVCECALGSDDVTDVLVLPSPGEHVVLVDHTAGGFVALALDAPSTAPLRALATRWDVHSLLASEGGPVDGLVEVDVPRVPLDVSLWARPLARAPVDAGAARGLHVEVRSPRGLVATLSESAFVMHRAAPGAGLPASGGWQALPLPGAWEEQEDHHAYERGRHLVLVQAEWLRGEVLLGVQAYVRE